MPAYSPPGWGWLAWAHARFGVGSVLPDSNDVILMYHSIGDGFGLPERTFRNHLAFLTEQYQVVDLPALRADDAAGKRVALTFDDGTSDFYDTVFPLLEEHDVPATVFPIGETLTEGSFQQDDTQDYDYLDVDQLRELAATERVHVGNHTLTHRSLPELSETEQAREIRLGKRRLEDRLDCEIDRFCYPYNDYDSTAVDVVSDTHEVAVVGEGRRRSIDAETNDVLLPRLNAETDLTTLRWDVHDASTMVWRPASTAFQALPA